jgi:hypothetical protein
LPDLLPPADLLWDGPDRLLPAGLLVDFPGLPLDVALLVDLPLFDFAMSPPGFCLPVIVVGFSAKAR